MCLGRLKPRERRENLYRLPPILERSAVITRQELGELIDWGQELIGLPTAWHTADGQGIRVAVLDTGCDFGHPDLQGAFLESQDFTRSRYGADDRDGHGTHCASVIGARANGIGMRGAASGAQLLIGKALGDDGTGSDRNIARAINWASDNKADVISMSMGSYQPSPLIAEAIAAAVAAGAFVICAAGNDGTRNSVNWPAAYETTIAVGAVDEGGRVARYSSRGPELDIAAPGSNVLGCAPGGSYVRMTGTSMATPLVAACVALALGWHRQAIAFPINTLESLRKLLASTAKDAGDVGRDDAYGWGLIQPASMLPPAAEPTPDDSHDPYGWAIDDVEAFAYDAATKQLRYRAGAETIKRETLNGIKEAVSESMAQALRPGRAA